VSEPLAFLVGAGARSPLGLSAAQVALCRRARKNEPRATRFRDRLGGEIGACHARCLPDTIHGYDRLLRLASPALAEALPEGLAEPVPLVVALPEPGRADDDARFTDGFVRDLAARSKRRIDVAASLSVRAGHAGGALAFEAALGMMARPGGPALVAVGGVDGYFHPDVLADLDAELRLHGSADDGFIPSEGAAFVLLARRRQELPALGTLRQVRCGIEEEPHLASGLTELLHAVREEAARESGPVRWVISDVNGESHRVRAFQLAAMRALDVELFHDALPDEMGDVGAASGPMAAVIACTLFEAGCAPAGEVLVVLSSEGAERGALRIGGPS
jgi:3-oxoacyl-[acyl-carrier-protein] synthase-1